MEKDNYGKTTWVFHVQSTEDFYNQLKAFEQEHGLIDQTVDEHTDLTLARKMLQAIGIRTK
jgi:macrodomain Ter protein organizer (MatP/YcbG family)